MDREIRQSIMKVINEQKVAGHIENNLLNTLVAANDINGSKASDKFVAESCKTIYFEGHKTSSNALKWGLLLLALNPEWQARVRAEITAVSRQHLPDANALRQMKLPAMVIQETMRLYSIGPLLLRETLQEELKFGDIWFPRGVEVIVPVAALHHDPDIWGPDAGEFNPERLANGASKACKFPNLYTPFGFGPRACLGLNFAMAELKIILSLMLGKFSFTLSPNYCHSVVFGIVLEPEFGVDLVVRKA
ncbi:putative 11-oxo-beta-amyrin 30-oxidase [Dioscorea sansibarensis]